MDVLNCSLFLDEFFFFCSWRLTGISRPKIKRSKIPGFGIGIEPACLLETKRSNGFLFLIQIFFKKCPNLGTAMLRSRLRGFVLSLCPVPVRRGGGRGGGYGGGNKSAGSLKDWKCGLQYHPPQDEGRGKGGSNF